MSPPPPARAAAEIVSAAAFYFTMRAFYYIITRMKTAENWKDYTIIATGDGMKLERWGDVVLLRPDPQVIWHPSFDLYSYKGLNAVYRRSSRGGGGSGGSDRGGRGGIGLVLVHQHGLAGLDLDLIRLSVDVAQRKPARAALGFAAIILLNKSEKIVREILRGDIFVFLEILFLLRTHCRNLSCVFDRKKA